LVRTPLYQVDLSVFSWDAIGPILEHCDCITAYSVHIFIDFNFLIENKLMAFLPRVCTNTIMCLTLRGKILQKADPPLRKFGILS